MPPTMMPRDLKLRTLIWLLQQQQAIDTFNMSIWYRKADTEEGDSDQSVECGYAACALGQAAIYPPFMEMGLRVELLSSSGFVSFKKDERDYHHTRAGAAFFDLTVGEASFIFDVDEYYWASSYDVMQDEVHKAGYNLDDFFLNSDKYGPKEIPIETVIRRIDFVLNHPRAIRLDYEDEEVLDAFHTSFEGNE